MASAIGAANGAKYRMMSPAKLPISRSPCLTVPPGLSPGALLDSPVLLNNAKAEASPTTGTLSFHSMVNNTVGSNSLCSPSGTYRNSARDEGSSGNFEFKPHIRTFSCSGLSSFGHLASNNPTQQGHESSRKIQSHPESHSLESSQSVQNENTAPSSHELTISVTASDPPMQTLQSEANGSDGVGPDELQHTKGSVNGKQALQCDINGLSSSTVVEKSSEDGYNWRKYGQKHVKGCEFPRSYYKCTHPNCQVKKLLERSHDGQMAEVIYKGQHDHPKPEPNRRLAFAPILSGQGEERSGRLSSLASAEDKLSNVHYMDPHGNIDHFPASPCDDDAKVGVEGLNHNADEVASTDDPESKRRKVDTVTFDATQIGKTNREPRVVVQTISEVDILDDGYRWRKYGQKVVKGNPNPRSYYKCTNVGCSVRKHVERASHDPKAVITTYEGKHNHDVPAPRTSSHDTATPMITTQMCTALNGSTVTTSHLCRRPEETDTISLDLGVGISTNRNGLSNGLCGSREGNAQGFSFRTSSPSERYYSNSGNLVTGP